VRHTLIDTAARAAAIRLTVTDIFDQAAPPVIVAAAPSKVPAPTKAIAATVPGLAYELHIKDSKRRVNYFNPPLQKPNEEHHWLFLAEIAQGRLLRSGLARGFDLGVCEQRTSGYALVFKGLLRVPEAGLYIFRAQIDGGYRIRIDGDDVLVWDGQHGTTEKAAVRPLSKGGHPLEVTYLYDQLPARNFSIDWEGPCRPRQAIPLDALRVVDSGAYPVPTVEADAPGNGTGRIAVTVNARGHEVNKTALFLGSLQLAASDGPAWPWPAPARGSWWSGRHRRDSSEPPMEATRGRRPTAASVATTWRSAAWPSTRKIR